MYLRQLIFWCLAELKVTYNKVSVEAYAAFTPRNLQCEELFWTRCLPLGKMGIKRRKLIDMDEFTVEHRKLNGTKGGEVLCYRVRTVGNYTKEKKLTVILMIEAGDPGLVDVRDGRIAQPRRWIKTCRVGGTDTTAFASFCDEICTLIDGVQHIAGTDEH